MGLPSGALEDFARGCLLQRPLLKCPGLVDKATPDNFFASNGDQAVAPFRAVDVSVGKASNPIHLPSQAFQNVHDSCPLQALAVGNAVLLHPQRIDFELEHRTKSLADLNDYLASARAHKAYWKEPDFMAFLFRCLVEDGAARLAQ